MYSQNKKLRFSSPANTLWLKQYTITFGKGLVREVVHFMAKFVLIFFEKLKIYLNILNCIISNK